MGAPLCPRCDGQGAIRRVRLKKDGRILFVCAECDATWFDEHAIGVNRWLDFETYLKSEGVTAPWHGIEWLKD